MDTLVNKNMKFESYLEYESDHSHYGVMGIPTKYKDKYGNKLNVGDVVLFYHPDKDLAYINFVVNPRFRGGIKYPLIMGCFDYCNPFTGEIEEVKVVKIKDYTEVVDGEYCEDVVAHVCNED